MNGATTHTLTRLARRTAFGLLVTGIIVVILTPIVFLVSLSFMSDAEAYNEWPLPLIPAFSVRIRIEPSETGYRVSRYSRAEAGHVLLLENADPDHISAFLRRKLNVRVTPEQLARATAELTQRPHVELTARKSLLANYATFFRVTHNAGPAVLRSLKTAFASILISLLIGGAAGYAFARYPFKGKHLLRLSVLFVRIFPGVAVAIPMVVILARIGLYDNPLGLALVYSVGQIALTVWITASVFMGIPIELEEAAAVFGCSRAGVFFHVTLPLALPGLAACAMYAFIFSWNETIQAIVLTQSNPTFPVVVYQSLVGSKGMVNLVAAGGVTLALPAVIVTLLIRKYVLHMWSGVRL